MNIKIINANPSQADIISSIGRQSFRDAFSQLFKSKEELKEYLDYTYQPDKIKKRIEKEKNVFFLAFVKNVRVGFVKLKGYWLIKRLDSLEKMNWKKIKIWSNYIEGVADV